MTKQLDERIPRLIQEANDWWEQVWDLMDEPQHAEAYQHAIWELNDRLRMLGELMPVKPRCEATGDMFLPDPRDVSGGPVIKQINRLLAVPHKR